jgi:hypothetical protein
VRAVPRRERGSRTRPKAIKTSGANSLAASGPPHLSTQDLCSQGAGATGLVVLVVLVAVGLVAAVPVVLVAVGLVVAVLTGAAEGGGVREMRPARTLSPQIAWGGNNTHSTLVPACCSLSLPGSDPVSVDTRCAQTPHPARTL